MIAVDVMPHCREVLCCVSFHSSRSENEYVYAVCCILEEMLIVSSCNCISVVMFSGDDEYVESDVGRCEVGFLCDEVIEGVRKVAMVVWSLFD